MKDPFNQGKVEIPLSEGKIWTQKYLHSSKEDDVYAYLIPLDALKLAMKNDVDAVRAYKGINNEGEETLLFVGTKLDKETGIYVDVFFDGVSENSKTGDVVVYDTSRPCPPYGDPNSPLP